MKKVLASKNSRILTVVLLLQAAAFYGFSRSEDIPPHRPLQDFVLDDSSWILREDVQIPKDQLDALNADDILSRLYQQGSGGPFATLFVAYFETQRTGKTPHSPKNCLPGSGWVPSVSGTIDIAVPGRAQPVNVNRYIVSRGQNESVVLYWYQERSRVIASEYAAKIFTVTDAIRYNRTDTSLVRVVVPVENGDARQATKTAISFVKAFFTPLQQYLPS